MNFRSLPFKPLQTRVALSLVGSVALSGLYYAKGTAIVDRWGSAPICLFAVLLCLILPQRASILYLFALCTAYFTTRQANAIKVSLTTAPLTWTDIRVFAFQPNASLDALKMSPLAKVSIIAGVLILLTLIGGALVLSVTRAPHLGTRVLGLGLFMATGVFFASNVNAAVHDFLATRNLAAWDPVQLSKLVQRIGLPVFLLYSRHLEGTHSPLFYSLNWSEPPAPKNIQESLKSVLNIDRTRKKNLLPNIVAILAESTFDPNNVFDLKYPFESFLFKPNPLTHAVGPLYVNTIGGGTWISEFEFLTGLDTRLFGYEGFYTHVTLAPRVKRTLVHHLRERGYSAKAYYGTAADFFRAREAFVDYGFERLLEKQDLHINATGWSATDTEIVDAVIAASSDDTNAQFFKFIDFVENHSNHTCKVTTEDSFVNYFSAMASFDYNCQLNEYLRRARSSEEAVRRMIRYLTDIETRTGRPFVLVVFGDHQPHSFTRTADSHNDFRSFRKNLDPRITFFHFMSSAENVMKWSDRKIIPLTLLPTLLSAYAAADYHDIYLPVNVHSFVVCGYDPIGKAPSQGFMPVSDLENYLGTTPDEQRGCPILTNLVTAYRESGIMRLN